MDKESGRQTGRGVTVEMILAENQKIDEGSRDWRVTLLYDPRIIDQRRGQELSEVMSSLHEDCFTISATFVSGYCAPEITFRGRTYHSVMDLMSAIEEAKEDPRYAARRAVVDYYRNLVERAEELASRR